MLNFMWGVLAGVVLTIAVLMIFGASHNTRADDEGE